MNDAIELRPATIQDAEMLLYWRNEPNTRKASHNSSEIVWENHIAWMTKTLSNSDRRLYVAERHGTPVGTVRADLSCGVWEVSWTVAPDARGCGVAKRMVALLTGQINDPIRAEVKVGNIASARIAEHAGMVLDREAGGVWYFSREKK